MKCIEKKECMVCAYRRWDVQMCKQDACTYQMCKRCIFLYGRNKPCPACRRENTFAISQYRVYRCTDVVVNSPHVECVCTFVFFPMFVIFGIATLGNLILYTIDPYCCMVQNFAVFLIQGFLVMIPITCLIMCLCGCCKENEPEWT